MNMSLKPYIMFRSAQFISIKKNTLIKYYLLLEFSELEKTVSYGRYSSTKSSNSSGNVLEGFSKFINDLLKTFSSSRTNLNSVSPSGKLNFELNNFYVLVFDYKSLLNYVINIK